MRGEEIELAGTKGPEPLVQVPIMAALSIPVRAPRPSEDVPRAPPIEIAVPRKSLRYPHAGPHPSIEGLTK